LGAKTEPQSGSGLGRLTVSLASISTPVSIDFWYFLFRDGIPDPVDGPARTGDNSAQWHGRGAGTGDAGYWKRLRERLHRDWANNGKEYMPADFARIFLNSEK
jgi:hypothetical protein